MSTGRQLCLLVIASMVALAAGSFDFSKVTEKPELFSYEKLRKYTSLASCFAKIHEQFAYCNKKAEEKGKAYLEGVDPESEWARRVKCCGTWRLRDCWVAAAREKCDPMQAEQVHNLPYTFMPQLEEMCKDYPPGSGKCKFPWLIIILTVVGLALLIAVGIFFGVRFYRRRRQRKENLARNNHTLGITEKDVKPTAV